MVEISTAHEVSATHDGIVGDCPEGGHHMLFKPLEIQLWRQQSGIVVLLTGGQT
jgi:hypothetical protein